MSDVTVEPTGSTETTAPQDDPELIAQNRLLAEQGEQAQALAKRLGTTSGNVRDLAQELAKIICKVRGVIVRQMTVKTEGEPDRSVAVRALDGRGAAYQAWYKANVTEVLEATAPVEYVDHLTEKDENGQPRKVAVAGGNFVRSSQRSIQHYVDSYLPGFIRENDWLADAEILGINMETPAERAARGGGGRGGAGGDGGTTAAKRVENVFGAILKATPHQVEGSDEPIEFVDPPQVQEAANMVVIAVEALRDALGPNTVGMMPTEVRKQVALQIGRAEKALDHCIAAMEAQETSK